jgi:hypothetical protein
MEDLEVFRTLMVDGESPQDCVRRIKIERQAMHEAIAQLIKEKELAYASAERYRNQLDDSKEAMDLAAALANFVRHYSEL